MFSSPFLFEECIHKKLKLDSVNGFIMKAKGWCATGLASIFSFFSGCGGAAMNKDAKQITNFKWYAVATAPRDYPMEVIGGEIIYKGGGGSSPIPYGGTLTTGWGKSASGYSGGPENPPLPDRVKITFYSYAENQSYQADFALPYDIILAKFQQQPKEHPNESNYDQILLGIAPGGAVSVWLDGMRTIEVYFGQAEKIELTPSEAFRLPFKSKQQSDEYVEKALAGNVTPEQLAYIKTHGAPIGAWARFRNLYKWSPVYREGKNPTRSEMPANFLNGERYELPTHFNEEFANIPKPLPSHLEFRAQATQDERPVYIIDFEPFELMEAFEKLGSHGEKVFIEFDAQVPRQNMKIRVYKDKIPKDDKIPREVIELKKFKVKP